jgi:anti-sigma factor RsiW
MKNDPLSTRFRELSWRRKLSPSESEELRAWLAAHPEAQEDWDAEIGLSETLDRLPNVPVASNFTARVLQAVEREDNAVQRRVHAGWRISKWLKWLPRTAFAAAAVTASLIGVHTIWEHKRAEAYRQSVTAVSEVASLPSPEILQDFDAIRDLNPAPDEELLQAFQ